MNHPHFIARPYYNTVVGVIDFDGMGFERQIDLELELNVWCSASKSLVVVEVFEFQGRGYRKVGEWRNDDWKDKTFDLAPFPSVGRG